MRPVQSKLHVFASASPWPTALRSIRYNNKVQAINIGTIAYDITEKFHYSGCNLKEKKSLLNENAANNGLPPPLLLLLPSTASSLSSD